MKRILKAAITLSVLCLIVAAVWFAGNYVKILPEQDSAEAAKLVAKRYIDRPVEITAVVSGSEQTFPIGEARSFEIYEGDEIIGSVQIQNFLGLGWQEAEFKRHNP